jgi:hypothetical protein
MKVLKMGASVPRDAVMRAGSAIAFGGDGAAMLHFRTMPGLHRVSDYVATASLAQQINGLLPGPWTAALILSSGHGAMRPRAPGQAMADRWVQALLVGAAIALNKHESQDGHWVTIYDHAEEVIRAIWRDADGDIQTEWEAGSPMSLQDWKDTDFGANAHAILQEVKNRLAEVDASPDEVVKRALTQRAKRERATH